MNFDELDIQTTDHPCISQELLLQMICEEHYAWIEPCIKDGSLHLQTVYNPGSPDIIMLDDFKRFVQKYGQIALSTFNHVDIPHTIGCPQYKFNVTEHADMNDIVYTKALHDVLEICEYISQCKSLSLVLDPDSVVHAIQFVIRGCIYPIAADEKGDAVIFNRYNSQPRQEILYGLYRYLKILLKASDGIDTDKVYVDFNFVEYLLYQFELGNGWSCDVWFRSYPATYQDNYGLLKLKSFLEFIKSPVEDLDRYYTMKRRCSCLTGAGNTKLLMA